jgi:hypothetical protein
VTAPNLQALQLVDVPQQMIPYRTNGLQPETNSIVTSGENNTSFTAYINISAWLGADERMVPLQWFGYIIVFQIGSGRFGLNFQRFRCLAFPAYMNQYGKKACMNC